MLKKKNRLKNKKDFEKIFKQGESFKNKFLIVKIDENKLNFPRIGIVVSKKVSKRSVVRNKIKRRLREIVKEKIKKLKNKKIDCIFIVLPEARNKNFKETEKVVENLFKKIETFSSSTRK